MVTEVDRKTLMSRIWRLFVSRYIILTPITISRETCKAKKIIYVFTTE